MRWYEIACVLLMNPQRIMPEGDSEVPDDALPDEIRQSDWETMGDDEGEEEE